MKLFSGFKRWSDLLLTRQIQEFETNGSFFWLRQLHPPYYWARIIGNLSVLATNVYGMSSQNLDLKPVARVGFSGVKKTSYLLKGGRTVSLDAAPELAFERLVKSSERVRDLGEVFTPSTTVQDMLDLLPNKLWNVHPSTTFLEPACGDGNFLVAILDRKLERLSKELDSLSIASGVDDEAAQFHALEAIASIYAIDISSENIVGGVPGHEIGARTRLLTLFSEWHELELGKTLTPRSVVFKAAKWIVDHNLIVGNMLAIDSNGKPTGRDNIPLIEYSFNPANQNVTLFKTTMGDVISSEEAKTGEMLSLFPAEEPKKFWTGKALSMGVAEIVEAPSLVGPVRNGTGRRTE